MSCRTVIHMSPSRILEPYLDQLAHLIADHGIQAFESDIARLVVRLRATGHHGPLIAVLADKHAAGVARERAFGQLLGLLVDGVSRPVAEPARAVARPAA